MKRASLERRGLALAPFAVALFVGGPAMAQEATGVAASPTSAESLYREGLLAMEEGDLAAACPKLAESHRTEPAAGAALALGLCLERQEKIPDAVRAYEDAERLARALGDQERAEAAATRSAELRRRAPTVASGPTVPAAPAPPALDPSARSVAPPPPSAGAAEPDGGPSAMTVVGLSAGGLGLVAMGFGAAFGIAGAGDASALEELGYDEDAGTCRSDLARCQSLYRSADGAGRVSVIAWAAGAALVAAGITMVVLGSEDGSEPSLAVRVTGGGASLGARYAP